MHDYGAWHSAKNEPLKSTEHQLLAGSKDTGETSDDGSPALEPTPTHTEEKKTHKAESLVGLVRHAYLRLLAGDPGDARHTLERALASEGFSTAPLLSAPTAQKQPSRATKGVHEASPTAPGREISQQGNSPIVIKTLGTFEVLVNGRAPGTTRKPPHRLLGILKVLIAKGGCAVNRSVLLDALWPDLDGDHANDAQQVALHRLRRLLSHHDALIINHGYVSLNPQLVEVDAFTLDGLCRNPFIQGFQQRARTALKLYQGTFLPDELESAWSQRMRECMLAKFVNIVSAAGKELETQNDFEGAAALYEQALSADDLENIIGDGLVRALRRGKTPKKRPQLTLNPAH
jgi:DNA-binding SARP family transcriptional activator